MYIYMCVCVEDEKYTKNFSRRTSREESVLEDVHADE